MIDFEIVIPVYNEEVQLPESVSRLVEFLKKNFSEKVWAVTIADNASKDKTAEVSRSLCQRYQQVKYFYLEQKGRGRALKKTWAKSAARVVCYMDVDLSTHIRHIPELVNVLLNNQADISIGSRLLPGSRIKRCLKREIISRAYNLIIKLLHGTKFSDAQCGFKAIKKEVFMTLAPRIQNNEWFFDSELLILGEKMGYKIHEIAVEWNEDMGSTVKIIPTAMEDLKGLWRLWKEKPWR